jgi:hypothetical protein
MLSPTRWDSCALQMSVSAGEGRDALHECGDIIVVARGDCGVVSVLRHASPVAAVYDGVLQLVELLNILGSLVITDVERLNSVGSVLSADAERSNKVGSVFTADVERPNQVGSVEVSPPRARRQSWIRRHRAWIARQLS